MPRRRSFQATARGAAGFVSHRNVSKTSADTVNTRSRSTGAARRLKGGAGRLCPGNCNAGHRHDWDAGQERGLEHTPAVSNSALPRAEGAAREKETPCSCLFFEHHPRSRSAMVQGIDDAGPWQRQRPSCATFPRSTPPQLWINAPPLAFAVRHNRRPFAGTHNRAQGGWLCSQVDGLIRIDHGRSRPVRPRSSTSRPHSARMAVAASSCTAFTFTCRLPHH
jgi:hypothetical protein